MSIYEGGFGLGRTLEYFAPFKDANKMSRGLVVYKKKNHLG